MNLRQAFTHQNTIKEAISGISGILYISDNIFDITTEHQRNVRVQDAKPFTEDNSARRTTDFTVKELVDAMISLLAQKEALTKAIRVAKSGLEEDIDGALSLNANKRFVISALRPLTKAKESESKSESRDYTFNVEGNQTSYVYPVVQKKGLRYDKDEVQKTLRSLEDDTSDVSSKLDELYVTTPVYYTPVIKENDTIDEVIAKCIAKQS